MIGQSEHKARIPSSQRERQTNQRTVVIRLDQSHASGQARAARATGEKRHGLNDTQRNRFS